MHRKSTGKKPATASAEAALTNSLATLLTVTNNTGHIAVQDGIIIANVRPLRCLLTDVVYGRTPMIIVRASGSCVT